MEKFLRLQRVFSLDDFLSGWFRGSSIDLILRDNVEEFMAYAFLCKPLTQMCTRVGKLFPATCYAISECPNANWSLYGLPQSHIESMQDRTQVAYFVTRCEEAWSTNFLEGKNHNITFMAHLWEPLRVHRKPLVVHLFSEVAGAASRIWLLMLGFRMQRHQVYQIGSC